MDNSESSPQPRPRTGTKPTSLKDIAARAGVSYSLVSKVLRSRMGNAGVREEVRDRIMKIAAEMNYRPHSLASDLKMGRKGAIGVLLHPFGVEGSGLVELFLRGLSGALDQRSLRMWLTFFEFDEQLVDHLNMRMRHDIDGLIVAGVPHPSTYSLIKELHNSGLPIVTMMEEGPIDDIPSVAQDRRMQGYLCAQHLIQQGCRRIANMGYPLAESRHQGVLAAHHEAGLELIPELDYQFTGFKAKDGQTAVEHWLAKGIAFDAVIAQSDQQAWGIIQALAKHGLRVPQDVRVTGMDNSVLSEISTVPITSVTSEMELVGSRTVEMLADIIDGKDVKTTSLPVHLVARASTA